MQKELANRKKDLLLPTQHFQLIITYYISTKVNRVYVVYTVLYVKTRNTGEKAGDKKITTVKLLHATQGAERSSLHARPLFCTGMSPLFTCIYGSA